MIQIFGVLATLEGRHGLQVSSLLDNLHLKRLIRSERLICIFSTVHQNSRRARKLSSSASEHKKRVISSVIRVDVLTRQVGASKTLYSVCVLSPFFKRSQVSSLETHF